MALASIAGSLLNPVIAATIGGSPGAEAAPNSESADNLLALTWQPAFCELRPVKSECQALNRGRLPVAARQLSIHGLWPRPRGNDYCGVAEAVKRLDKAGRWSELPAPKLDAETNAQLTEAMPGMASQLHRHEWVKHGTCYFADRGADEYFDDTIRIAETINRSAVGRFLADRIGARVTAAEIRARFDQAFGPGAGDRVGITCKRDGRRTLIQELKIALKGTISPDTPARKLIQAAAPLPPGCPGGIIDAAGLQ